MSPAGSRGPAKTAFLGHNRSGLRSANRTTQLSAQHLDLWEHAALLYLNYEWQAAADTFASLARYIKEVELSSRCVLNTVLIQAQLGDFHAAQNTLEAAVIAMSSYPLATFVAGFIAYELRDFKKAEGCFELCFKHLFAYGDVTYGSIAPDFVLDRGSVLENLRAVRGIEFRAHITGVDAVALNGVPAEFIFEAPLRDDGTANSRRQASRPGDALMPTTSVKAAEKTLKWLKKARTAQDDQAQYPLSRTASLPSQQLVHSQTNPIHRSRTTSRDPWESIQAPHVIRAAPELTKSPAHLVRTAIHSQHRHLVPRDARGEYNSAQELAWFLDPYAPDRRSESKIARLVLKENVAVGSEAQSDAPHSDGRNGPASKPAKDQAGTQSSAKSSSTEILLPTVYTSINKSSNKGTLAYPSLPLLSEKPPTDPTPPSLLTRSKTCASPVCIRIQQARERALQMLEGRLRPQSARDGPGQGRPLTWIELNKPLPPVPVRQDALDSQSGSVQKMRSAVRTENFFEAVLGAG